MSRRSDGAGGFFTEKLIGHSEPEPQAAGGTAGFFLLRLHLRFLFFLASPSGVRAGSEFLGRAAKPKTPPGWLLKAIVFQRPTAGTAFSSFLGERLFGRPGFPQASRDTFPALSSLNQSSWGQITGILLPSSSSMGSRWNTHSSHARDTDLPVFPARAVRPIRWM
jgi:hypothetical protein